MWQAQSPHIVSTLQPKSITPACADRQELAVNSRREAMFLAQVSRKRLYESSKDMSVALTKQFYVK